MSEDRTGQEPDATDELNLDDPEIDDEIDPLEPAESSEPAEPAEPLEPAARPTRAERLARFQQRRIQEQEEELKRWRDAALQRQPAQPTFTPPPDPMRQAQADREEQERVAQLPYEEQSRYWARKEGESMRQQMLRQQLETRDMLDRSNFSQIMSAKKLPARYATEVENLLIQARQQGMNPSRDWLLNAVIGKEVLEKQSRETERQRRNGAARIASQTTTPARTGSTAATAGGRRNVNQDAEDEALLRSVTIGQVLNSGF